MSTAQYMDALGKANETRLARAETKRQIRAGEKTVFDAITKPCFAKATFASLLAAQRRWGPRRTTRFLTRLSWEQVFISEFRLVQDLTEREIEVLRRALEGRA